MAEAIDIKIVLQLQYTLVCFTLLSTANRHSSNLDAGDKLNYFIYF